MPLWGKVALPWWGAREALSNGSGPPSPEVPDCRDRREGALVSLPLRLQATCRVRLPRLRDGRATPMRAPCGRVPAPLPPARAAEALPARPHLGLAFARLLAGSL